MQWNHKYAYKPTVQPTNQQANTVKKEEGNRR